MEMSKQSKVDEILKVLDQHSLNYKEVKGYIYTPGVTVLRAVWEEKQPGYVDPLPWLESPEWLVAVHQDLSVFTSKELQEALRYIERTYGLGSLSIPEPYGELPRKTGRGGEMEMSDPILAEVISQICSTGICLAEPKKKSKHLPICSPAQAKARESCIIKLKPRQKAGEIKSAFAVCNVSIGCRPARKDKK